MSACESTESESAKIGREAGASETASSLNIGAVDREVRVSNVTLLSGAGRTALAVKLTSSSSRSKREVPLLVKATGDGGKVLYTNATGAEPLLQRVTLLRAHASTWWVDDEVLTSGKATSATVAVGTGKSSHADARSTALSATTSPLTGQSGSISALLTNHTGRAQSGVPVFAVALRGEKVVAAGRAVAASVPAHGQATSLDIPLVGDASGAKIVLTALPPSQTAAGGGLK
ncbi:MAG: hypothetical protein ACYDHT_12510 [Solirubrobacteraceae bacterium]